MTSRCFLLLSAAAAFTLAACDSTAPDSGAGDAELITRVTLTFTPEGGGAAATATYNDADGDGILDAGEFTTLSLKAGTTYTGTVTFAGAGEDVTAEVRAEAAEHQVLYTAGGAVVGRLTVTPTDTDNNGLPVGLSTRAVVTAGAATTGTLRVVLSHYDGEAKRAGVPSSEADFDGAFPVAIVL